MVGTGRPGGADVGNDLLVLAPGDAGRVRAGFEAARLVLVVAEHGDLQALFLDPQRAVGLGQVAAATEVSDAGGSQVIQGFHEGNRAIVAGVIVGQRYGVEAAAQYFQGVGPGAEGPQFGRLGATAGGDGTFEIANPVVGSSQDGGEGGERVAAGGNGPAGAVVEHHVASEDQGQRLGVGGAGQPAEQGQRRQGSQVAAAGIHGASRISHQYCSSLSRFGS